MGDGRNNVANSLMVACSKMGINFTCCSPKSLWPEKELVDKMVGYEIGRDDYITKPFEIEELLARIRVVLRRLGQEKAEKYDYKFGPFEINLLKHQFMVDGKRVHLTPKEFSLMVVLIKEPGVVQTRDDLLNEIWGYDFDGQTNTVDVYIRALRNKLGKYRDLIKTVRGIGYVLGDEQ